MIENKSFVGNDQFKRLCQWADQLCGFYASQAYLVGSSLASKDFRDVDVVIVISDEDFEMRYGNKYDIWEERGQKPLSEMSWKYYKDRIKRVRDGYHATKLELDVKIQCETEFLGHAHDNKIRIDTSPFLPHLEEKTRLYALPPAEQEDVTKSNGEEMHRIDDRPEKITVMHHPV